MKVAFETLGCRMNQFDTDLIRSEFAKKGYQIVEPGEVADVYIINTCTVTVGGDRSSRQAIYRAKRRNPRAVVVATGCYAQVRPEELARLKEVDLVVGNTHKGEILKIVEEYLERKEKKVVVGEIFREKEVRTFGSVLYFEGVRPFLKVQEGCNKFCSFCVIPFARGKVRSVEKERVVAEVKSLAERGFKEVVLTGTQLSQYGWDRGYTLYELLRDILRETKIELVRLSSLHVKELDRNLLELIASEERIAPHFHLSLQSGSNRILALMERGYTREEYEEVVLFLKEKRPESSIGTDVIAGFPGEGEEEFGETYEFLKKLPIAYMHVFPYSDRPNTKALRLGPKVPERIKKERVRLLKELDEEKRRAFYEENRVRELRAIVIEENRLLTENYIDLRREGYREVGSLVRIKL
ncbi:MAG: tRNA (N(6)-L-threonylcarbamoyladenosine(37)-C(2))-methylthiotransferase MtaB [Aquificae bacterium]|nr:tRNA (N(6)-L-threonylcarbamoyladenosine(37)-C(2))-methylthiotransferase MtaB [Aquificota bacterium]